MKTHDLGKLLEAVPYDFDVKVIAEFGVKEATFLMVDFEKKVLTIGVV